MTNKTPIFLVMSSDPVSELRARKLPYMVVLKYIHHKIHLSAHKRFFNKSGKKAFCSRFFFTFRDMEYLGKLIMGIFSSLLKKYGVLVEFAHDHSEVTK